MITLNLMNSTEFQDYLNSAIKSYAKSNVQSGNWNEQESISKATEQYAHLLPDGEKTTDNKLFTIRSNGQEVGMIWFAVKPNKKGFIYDIKIREDYRGQGFGKQAMEDIEKLGREIGIKSIGLHVFAHNQIARGLYEKLGYEETSIVMAKRIINSISCSINGTRKHNERMIGSLCSTKGQQFNYFGEYSMDGIFAKFVNKTLCETA